VIAILPSFSITKAKWLSLTQTHLLEVIRIDISKTGFVKPISDIQISDSSLPRIICIFTSAIMLRSLEKTDFITLLNYQSTHWFYPMASELNQSRMVKLT